LIDEQDVEFKQIVNESRIQISDVDSINNKIRALAIRYFEASENAEKYIHNYNELKLNVELPLENRKGLREDALKSVTFAKDKEKEYDDSLEDANECLKDFVEKVKTYE